MQNHKIKNYYQNGIKFFQKKNFLEAINCFKKVLDIDSKYIEANHAIGVVYGALNDHKSAKDYFQKALNINPNFKPTLLNFAISLCALNEFTKSEKTFIKLIKLDQNNPEYLSQYGICLFKQNIFEKAEKFFLDSINLNSKDPNTYQYLGLIKKKTGSYEDSNAYLLKAIDLGKKNSELLYQIGENFYILKNYKKAIDYLYKSIDLGLNFNFLIHAKERIARSYDYLKQYDESIKVFEEILAHNPDTSIKSRIFMSLSNVHMNKNEKDFDADYSKSKYYAMETLKITKDDIPALNNLGIIELYSRNHDKSLNYFKKAYALNPLSPVTLKNLSNAYDHIGLYEENLKTIYEYQNVRPEDSSLNSNLATTLLSLGQFKKGWIYYENRWDQERADGTIRHAPNFEKPRWEPNLGFNRILVWGEQGIGDQILFGNMLMEFSKKFEKTYLAIDPKLIKLFSESFNHIDVYSLFDETSTDFFDYHIPLCSIGRYCRNSYKDFFPLKTHYKIKDEKNYPKNKNLKCALSWKSVNGNKSDFKSTTLEALKPILNLKNIDFYSIQYAGSEDEIKYVKDKYDIKINIVEGIDPFNNIYGLMKFLQTCDFTISTSSTNAHLSGALNIPTYLLLAKAYGKFWYWDNYYEGKNVWYPSVRRFIQKNYKDWDHPIEDLYQFLVSQYDLKF